MQNLKELVDFERREVAREGLESAPPQQHLVILSKYSK